VDVVRERRHERPSGDLNDDEDLGRRNDKSGLGVLVPMDFGFGELNT